VSGDDLQHDVNLLILPWLELDEPVYALGFQLVPYVRGEAPGSGDWTQDLFDRLMNRYLMENGDAVSKAAIVRIGDSGVLRELTQDERDQARTFVELATTSALSSRKFYRHQGYWNADNFRLEEEMVGPSGAMVGVWTRRRHGYHASLWSEGSYFVRRPDHVASGWAVDIDKDMLEALARSSHHAQWPAIWESAVNFNLANTDATYMSPRLELVLLLSAFERLLGHGSHELGALANGFLTHFTPVTHLDVDRAERFKKPSVLERVKRYSTIRELWFRDFVKLRGDLAHGRLQQRYPSIWTVEEHLLLGSLAFPLVLKSVLRALSLYTVTEEDEFWVDTFESLASIEHLSSGAQLHDSGEDLWSSTVAHARGEWTKARALADPTICFDE